MKLRRPKAAEQPETVLPLINIVFLLLIFFMVAGALEQAEPLPIEPPETRTGEAGDAAAIVLLGADGSLMVDGVPVSIDDLPRAVADLRAAGPEPEFRIKADKFADSHALIAVLQVLKDADVAEVDLLTLARTQ